MVTICSGQLQHHHQPWLSDKQPPGVSPVQQSLAEVMQLKVSEGKESLEEEEVLETGPGTKLGIVKLGKVAGKVSPGS